MVNNYYDTNDLKLYVIVIGVSLSPLAKNLYLSFQKLTAMERV